MYVLSMQITKILDALNSSEEYLLGRPVIFSDGKAGDITAVHLDDSHGLMVKVAGHEGKWPASTIKTFG